MTSPLADYVTPERLRRLTEVAEKRTEAITVVLDGVYHGHNISAVLRTADAFGVQTVHLVGSSFEFSKNISKGSERWIDLVFHDTPEAAADYFAGGTHKVVVMQAEGLSNTHEILASTPVHQLPFQQPLAFVFGSEKTGITPHLVSRADYAAYIPMCGFVESLNISVAAAICLHTALVIHSESIPRLNAEQQDTLIHRWLERDVTAAPEILARLKADD